MANIVSPSQEDVERMEGAIKWNCTIGCRQEGHQDTVVPNNRTEKM